MAWLAKQSSIEHVPGFEGQVAALAVWIGRAERATMIAPREAGAWEVSECVD